MSIYDSIVNFFYFGGVYMVPIALVLAIGLAITAERFIFLSNAKRSNRQAFDSLIPALEKGDYKQVIRIAQMSHAPISNIIAAGVSRLAHSPRREDIEYAMEEGVMEALPRLEKRTGYLAILANVATLLGLLGTIMGLIGAFTAVATADPAEKATLLSTHISTAMNTTAFGLIAAIPLLLFHKYLENKTSEIVDSLEMAGVKCLNIIGVRQKVEAKTRKSDSK